MAAPDPIRNQPFERALPNSAEAERAILGAILLDNGLISQAIEQLRDEDFYVPSHRRIFLAMVMLFERGAEINPILIGEELKKENALEAVGGISFITNLTYGLPHSTNIAHYAKVVRGKSMLRQLVKTSNKITQEALAEEDEPELILDHAEHAIFQLADERVRQGFMHVKPIAEQLLEKVQEMEGRAAVLTGLTTGFADLDKMTSGLQNADLIILAARPSMGKTSLVLNIAQHIATAGKVAGVFSLEMSKEQLFMRMLASEAKIDNYRLMSGQIGQKEYGQITHALETLSDAQLYIDDTPGIGVLEMRAKARRLQSEHGLQMLAIDYIQLMTGRGRFENRTLELASISRSLKGLAKELSVPVVVLSQLSRAPEARSDKRPQLSDLRESGALEQDADVVILIFREEMYKQSNEPAESDGIAELILAKQRNGPTGVVKLAFLRQQTRFANLADHA